MHLPPLILTHLNAPSLSLSLSLFPSLYLSLFLPLFLSLSLSLFLSPSLSLCPLSPTVPDACLSARITLCNLRGSYKNSASEHHNQKRTEERTPHTDGGANWSHSHLPTESGTGKELERAFNFYAQTFFWRTAQEPDLADKSLQKIFSRDAGTSSGFLNDSSGSLGSIFIVFYSFIDSKQYWSNGSQLC